ncbi:hypothetical protein [Lysinibacillus xylanilyticus]|uniref:hypothetical protein n=1 Tax=Lysinibacillus xylanilyticus TaxID=582475 RepID=UPI003D0232C3
MELNEKGEESHYLEMANNAAVRRMLCIKVKGRLLMVAKNGKGWLLSSLQRAIIKLGLR